MDPAHPTPSHPAPTPSYDHPCTTPCRCRVLADLESLIRSQDMPGDHTAAYEFVLRRANILYACGKNVSGAAPHGPPDAAGRSRCRPACQQACLACPPVCLPAGQPALCTPTQLQT